MILVLNGLLLTVLTVLSQIMATHIYSNMLNARLACWLNAKHQQQQDVDQRACEKPLNEFVSALEDRLRSKQCISSHFCRWTVANHAPNFLRDHFRVLSRAAARWVWESLWSTRRHAKVNILDIALFDGPGDGVASGTGGSPTIARWLFTAKDGRIMKKAAHNASVGALKQSLLGRVLRGALENSDSGDSRVSSKTAARQVFATALLSSGESVELDEGAWATWIVGGKCRQDRVSAVMALVPGNSVDHRRGSHHQVTCEFRVKTHGTTVGKGCVGDACSTPTQVSMTTYVLVSSGLLREEGDKHDEGQDKKHGGGGRLVSRVKATNDEVEAKLHRIVQWVQEARGVKVLGMTAMFTVLPSLTSGTPGVWLKRVQNVRIIPKEVGTAVAAPFADTPPVALAQRTIKAPGHEEPPTQLGPQYSVQSIPAAEGSCQPSEAVLARQESEDSDIPRPTAVKGMSSGAGNTVHASAESNSSAFARTAPPIDVGESATNQSITSIISAATNVVLSVGEQPLPQGGGDDTVLSSENGKIVSSSTATVASLNRRGRSIVGPEFSQSVARRRCAGNFCSYYGASSGLPAPTQGTDAGGDTGVGTVLNWTDVGMSDKDGGALLDVVDKSGAQFSLSLKSVALARAEAGKGHNWYWGECLRECYEEGGCRAGRLEELSPVQIYDEASIHHHITEKRFRFIKQYNGVRGTYCTSTCTRFLSREGGRLLVNLPYDVLRRM